MQSPGSEIGLAFIGGAIIGLSASVVLVLLGRVAGISGILANSLRRTPDAVHFSLPFVLGLALVGLLLQWLRPGAVPTGLGPTPIPLVIVAGLLVGFGTRRGGGCTSGHGVCGISRFSIRSVAATILFMIAGMVTVFVVRHVLGGFS